MKFRYTVPNGADVEAELTPDELATLLRVLLPILMQNKATEDGQTMRLLETILKTPQVT